MFSSGSAAGESLAQKGTTGNISSIFNVKTQRVFHPRFSELKKAMWKDPMAQSWAQVLDALKGKAEQIGSLGSKAIPKVHYDELQKGLTDERIAEIKEAGVVIVRGAVPREEALGWKKSIKDYIAENRDRVVGHPVLQPTFYELYNAKAQILARTHPKLVNTQKALLSLWHASDPNSEISLVQPISYFDRLRIREPGPFGWSLGPHIDGGGIERWEDPGYRACYARVFEGADSWRQLDSYDVTPRLTANQDLYDSPNQCTIFRAWQGWTSLSTTKTNEGTLRVVPFLKLSTAYVMLRPFFKPKPGRETSLEANDWELNLEHGEFPGTSPGRAQKLSPESHPHLQFDKTVVSIDFVEPGDQVYWHCDLIHAVEAKHTGTGDSSVLYIPAVPLTLKK
ncbi:DUF1479-domain-containing protein [Thelephora ganbajun]|uniref:DUF1479-domain-containing protein n=1 Tax=Thelephora ganbajun TaxID=370292 RepID=A0ACB6ZX26_THEGA|nr:DUF1479-domain-containing protein [Thelephora ganbajun]